MSITHLTNDQFSGCGKGQEERMTDPIAPSRRLGSGLLIALVAAASFGLSGPFVKPLLEAGWTPGAAVLWRTAGASVILVVPAIFALKGRWGILRRNLGTFFLYGIFAVLGSQLCYYSAIEHISVGVALLIEYLAPVFIVLFVWARSRRHPGWFTMAGAAVALTGLVLVLDLTGAATPNLIGVAWALTAAFGACIYYVVSARADDQLPPLVLAAASMIIASVVLAVLGVIGLFPIRATFGNVPFLGSTVSWMLPAAVILGMATVAGYLLGIAAISRLGTRIASFVGLTEVLFAVLSAWILLGQLPLPIQFIGGGLVLTGIVLVRLQRTSAHVQEIPEVTKRPTAERVSHAGGRE
jgi:drug/metabolite transporter (DMT)-like permease